jgi:hypothetical protein
VRRPAEPTYMRPTTVKRSASTHQITTRHVRPSRPRAGCGDHQVPSGEMTITEHHPEQREEAEAYVADGSANQARDRVDRAAHDRHAEHVGKKGVPENRAPDPAIAHRSVGHLAAHADREGDVGEVAIGLPWSPRGRALKILSSDVSGVPQSSRRPLPRPASRPSQAPRLRRTAR